MKNADTQQSPWSSVELTPQQLQSQHVPADVDAVVVGGGLAGVTAALLLAEAGHKVALVEMRDNLAGGDTAKTTAHLTALLDSSYAVLCKNFGDAGAKLIAEAHTAAMGLIDRNATRLKIACDYKQVPAHLYAVSKDDHKEIDDELEALGRIGLQAQSTQELGLPFATGPGLRLGKQAQFEPIAYIQALAERFVALGGTVHTGVRYKSIAPSKDGRRIVETSAGQIVATDVILATHTAPNKMLLQTKMVPMMTYSMAFRTKDAMPSGHFYSTESPYHYLRRHDDAQGSFVIAGGHDHRVGSIEDTQAPAQALEAWVREHFKVDEVLYRWSGMIFDAHDGAPYLGHNPGDAHAYVITGLSGNGMTSGTLGAMICTDAILGRENPWASVFTPARIKPLAQGAAFVAHNIEVTKHMVGDRLQAWLRKQPLAAQQGAVMQHEGHTAAVFNDGTKLHVLSPVCPHAGCYVKYNNADKTFDCPCHGSRFAHDGTLLAGPAVSDLPAL